MLCFCDLTLCSVYADNYATTKNCFMHIHKVILAVCLGMLICRCCDLEHRVTDPKVRLRPMVQPYLLFSLVVWIVYSDG